MADTAAAPASITGSNRVQSIIVSFEDGSVSVLEGAPLEGFLEWMNSVKILLECAKSLVPEAPPGLTEAPKG